MRTLFISIFSCLLLISCGNKNHKKETEQTVNDDPTVYVYYFHTKQRCSACIAVENVTKQTVTDNYAENSNVKYVEVNIDDAKDEPLIEKYRVAWYTLIITKGDIRVNITNDAFAWAENSPEALTEQITTEVNRFLE